MPLSLARRGLLGVIGLGLILLFATAARLQPDARGLGTHQQLGLPPCTFRFFLGVRCPSCGMTTSWAHFVRGQWIDAARASAGGLLAALVAVPAAIVALGSAVRGRWWPRAVPISWVAAILLVVALVTTLDWIRRLLGQG